MTGYPVTPRLTQHAQVRCGEMGVSTRRAKRVVQHPDVVYAARDDGELLARADADPDIAVVYAERGPEPPLIITVVWRTDETYNRATFVPSSQRDEETPRR